MYTKSKDKIFMIIEYTLSKKSENNKYKIYTQIIGIGNGHDPTHFLRSQVSNIELSLLSDQLSTSFCGPHHVVKRRVFSVGGVMAHQIRKKLRDRLLKRRLIFKANKKLY